MQEALKAYLGTDNDTLLGQMLDNARAWAVDYCNLTAYDPKLDAAVWRMVCEDWNRGHSEGISSKAYGGISESYSAQYSEQVLTMLRKHRRLKRL